VTAMPRGCLLSAYVSFLQPALLWIVPCMLTTVVVSAWYRGELSLMWHGWEGQCAEPGGNEAERLLCASPDASARV
jgi:Signal peptide peptidase